MSFGGCFHFMFVEKQVKTLRKPLKIRTNAKKKKSSEIKTQRVLIQITYLPVSWLIDYFS